MIVKERTKQTTPNKNEAKTKTNCEMFKLEENATLAKCLNANGISAQIA